MNFLRYARIRTTIRFQSHVQDPLLIFQCHTYSLGMCGFNDVRYNEKADKTIDFLGDACDDLSEKIPNCFKEVNLESGVLEIETSRGKYVLNKQAPNKQLWLSSPLSGPHHYNMKESLDGSLDVDWESGRDKHGLFQKLESEFTTISGLPIQLKR